MEQFVYQRLSIILLSFHNLAILAMAASLPDKLETEFLVTDIQGK